MADHVFICYARKDQDFVLKLAENLKERGVPVWLDQWNIPPGTDWYNSYKKAPQGGGAWIEKPRGAYRVFRGGSWNLVARNCRSAIRYRYPPGGRGSGVGFRVARSVALDP